MSRYSYGENPIADVLWGLALGGWESEWVGELEFGNYYLFLGIEPSDWPDLFKAAELPYDPSVVPKHKVSYILYCSERGFLDYWEYSSEDEALKVWNSILDDFDEWLGEENLE